MAGDVISNYRQVRVVLTPGKREWYVAVLTRTVSRGQQQDRMIFRTVMAPPGPTTTVSEVVEAAARALQQAADRL